MPPLVPPANLDAPDPLEVEHDENAATTARAIADMEAAADLPYAPLIRQHMPSITKEFVRQAVLQAKREGYAIALEETGPKARDDEQAERFKDYYRAAAARKFPE